MIRHSIVSASVIIFAFLLISCAAGNVSGVQIGDTVHPFSANDQNGNLWSLTDQLDKQFLVVYFYPAAMTGG